MRVELGCAVIVDSIIYLQARGTPEMGQLRIERS
jgi:hypothetical protein